MTKVSTNKKSYNRLTEEELDKMKSFAISFACTAGCEIIKEIKTRTQKKMKSDGSLVTKTDLKINELCIAAIRKEFPDHDILAEEGSYLKNKSRYRWVCDPIDGTIVFSRGVPTCVFSIALVENGAPVLGVVYDPVMDRMYSSILNNGAYMNLEKLKVSEDASLKGSVIGLSYWSGAQKSLFKLHGKLIEAGASVIMLGSIAYMGAMVARGELSASIHPARFPYDSAALRLIVSEAGGIVTSLYGKEQRYDRRITGAVMSNRKLHEKLLEMVRRNS